MRYAIISDLHGNRQALKAVLTDIRGIGVDQLICLGDCVGYGPRPAEVLELAYAHVHYFILGNHDAVIADRLTPDCFGENARKVIDWTRERLDAKSSQFFARMPLVLCGDGFACAHAQFANPGGFGYLFEAAAAAPSFDAFVEQFLFVGHSHVPGLFVLGGSGVPHWLEPLDFSREEGKRYLINVGSVGQPRDRDLRASYVIFDREQGDVFFRKVPFDIDGYRDDLRRSGLPRTSSCFLDLDERLRPRPLREMVDFRPARRSEFVRRERDVRSLESSLRQLKKSNRRLLVLAVCAFLISSAAVAWALARGGRSEPAAELDSSWTVAALQELVEPVLARVGDELVGMPAVDDFEAGELRPIDEDNRLLHWAFTLGDPESQRVAVERGEDGRAHFVVASRNPSQKIRIVSSAVELGREQRAQVRATFHNCAVERGFAELYSEYTAADGTVRRLNASMVDNLADLGRWSPRSATSEGLREDGGRLRYVLEFQFQGEARVRDCALVLR